MLSIFNWDKVNRRATTALLVIKDDNIAFEKYYLGTTENDRRISWSMAKSFVSILFGMQVDAKWITGSKQETIEFFRAIVKSLNNHDNPLNAQQISRVTNNLMNKMPKG